MIDYNALQEVHGLAAIVGATYASYLSSKMLKLKDISEMEKISLETLGALISRYAGYEAYRNIYRSIFRNYVRDLFRKEDLISFSSTFSRSHRWPIFIHGPLVS